MNPFDLFNPASYNPLDPATMMGVVDPQRLLDAAAVFPGGAAALVFALFWAPVGPGIPAGVLLARHAGLNPLITLGLYALSDILGAFVCHPWFTLLKRIAGRVPALRAVGKWFMKLALLGTRVPVAADQQAGARGVFQTLFRIGTIGFGMDVYTAGMLVAGLPVPRVAGWLAAIAGDLVWFVVLLITSIVSAQFSDNSTFQFVTMLVVMFLVPMIAKRYIPALRDAPAAPVVVHAAVTR
jgi:hypothetical protein